MNMKTTLTATTALLTGLLPLSALGQEVYWVDEITVSANLEETETDRSGSSVVIVTEDDLEKTSETRATDVLSRLPGVSIRTRGPLGTNAGLSIRGVPSSNIAVRVDGIDVSDPSGTQVAFDFGGLTTLGISRIEVLKGAQSAAYGSEAIGGVIDITSRRATQEGIEQSVDLEYGSYDTKKAAYGFAAKGARGELAFTLSHVETDGFSAADENDGNTEEDGFEATRLGFYGEYDLTETLTAVVSGFTEQSNFDWDEGGPLDGTPDEKSDNDTSGLRVALRFATGAVDHELSASVFDVNRVLTGSNAFGPFRWSYKGERETIGYQGAADLGAATRLVFGAEQVKETYTSNFGFGATSNDATITSAFAELNIAATDMLDVTGTVRLDDHSEFGDYVTGRLAAAYRPREDLIFRASLANGFRAPSPYELYDGFAGNAGLDPETSVSAEIGVEKRFGQQGVIKATAFWTEVEDMIDYSYTTYAYYQATGKVQRKGFELSTAWDFGMVDLAAAYTYNGRSSTAALDSSGWLSTTPRHTVSLSATTEITDKLSLTGTLLHGADRGAGLGDMTVVNATATYAINDGVEAYLRVENLFDEEYQTVPGYGTSDRAAFLGLRARF